jgi:hypothetical protein
MTMETREMKPSAELERTANEVERRGVMADPWTGYDESVSIVCGPSGGALVEISLREWRERDAALAAALAELHETRSRITCAIDFAHTQKDADLRLTEVMHALTEATSREVAEWAEELEPTCPTCHEPLGTCYPNAPAETSCPEEYAEAACVNPDCPRCGEIV